MADDNALRSRRKRLHAAGDHSTCRRCSAVRAEETLTRIASVPLPPAPAAELDPALEMRRLASRLAQEHERQPGNALLARELRATLQALLDASRQADSELTALFAEYGAS